jgi:hypothetical protein
VNIKVLIVWNTKGEPACEVSEKIGDLHDKARAARDTGMFNGVPVVKGTLIDSQAFPATVMSFSSVGAKPAVKGKK